jgi:hypothetical protein
MVLQSNAQRQQSAPLLSVHLVPLGLATTSGTASDGVSTPCSGTSVLRARRRSTFPNECTSTSLHTHVSSNSLSFLPTPGVFNPQTSTSHAELPKLDMKNYHSTFGHPPITPDSPLRPFSFGKGAAHGQDRIPGHLPPNHLHEPAHFSPGHAGPGNESPSSFQDQPSTSHYKLNVPLSQVLVEKDASRSWQFDPSGMLPTPVSPLPRDTGR